MSRISALKNTLQTIKSWGNKATKADFDRVAGEDGKISGAEAKAELKRTQGREPNRLDRRIFHKIAGADDKIDFEEAKAAKLRLKMIGIVD